jgi:hypothetical protein
MRGAQFAPEFATPGIRAQANLPPATMQNHPMLLSCGPPSGRRPSEAVFVTHFGASAPRRSSILWSALIGPEIAILSAKVTGTALPICLTIWTFQPTDVCGRSALRS